MAEEYDFDNLDQYRDNPKALLQVSVDFAGGRGEGEMREQAAS